MYALLIAKNADERAILSLALQRAGLAVTTASELERAMKSWLERPADMVVLAVSDEPLTQASRVRSETDVPIILVADGITEAGHCDLLEAGVDLVIPRPFGARLLVAQVRSLLRRAGNVPLSSLPSLDIAGLTLDPTARTVQMEDQSPRRLTHLEFRLLYTLMTHHGQILPNEVIVERVWGYSGRGDKDLVRGLVSRLRAKVEPEPRNPHFIHTVPGVGYSFDPEKA